jgi:uncharacterized protein
VISYDALTASAVFSTGPIEEPLTFAGPVLLSLRMSSSTRHADIFVALQAFEAQGAEATFETASEPASPVSLGWLRASHRKVDPERSGTLRPFHAHTKTDPLDPGRFYTVEVEVWPSSLHLPPGAELRLTVSGHDFQHPGQSSGLGHNDSVDRPTEVFGGSHTIATGPSTPTFLSLPSLKATS